MTTMNNEDPADPSVHEPRELPEPVAYLPAYELDRLRSGHTAMLRSAKFGPSEMDGDVPVYTADQMREAIAAERERQTKPPKWWKCKTHGDAQPNAWGCPECVREMRGELVMREAAADMTRLHTADAALADVAMMLKTCAWALRRGSAPELGERALELLKKHSLLGSPLRTETLDEAGRAGAHLYDRWTGKA